MKKKNQVIALLDDLRNSNQKTRLASVQSLKQIANGLGPIKTRTQFLHYLQEFVDDQEDIVAELLNQLSNFRAELGGEQHQKHLLTLLICFCKTDEDEQTQKSLSIMQPILSRNKDLILDVVRKLSKTEMNTAKYASAYLTTKLIHLVPNQQSQLIEIYSQMLSGYVPAYKIIAAKRLPELLQKVRNKEEVGKMLQLIYSDNDDLPKIYAMDALINYYPVDSVLVANKLKPLLAANNWRVNAKVCDIIPNCAKIFSKAAFKVTFQPSILKFLTSPEPQLRAKACFLLKPLALGMVEEDIKINLIPLIKKLASDPVNYVKVAASQNIVPLIEVMSGSLINEDLLPVIFTFIKSNDLAIGVLKNLQSLARKFPPEVIEQKILTPLITQLKTNDWKGKCSMIDLLNGVISNSAFLNDQLTKTLVGLTQDRISAVRQKATLLIVNIICQQSSQWSDSVLMPKIQCLKGSPSYVERQIMLEIIEKSFEKVTQKTLNEIYRPVLISCLNDKVPNVRAKALRVLKSSKNLNDKMFEKYADKLKSDPDNEVKKLAFEVEKMLI